MSSASLGVMLSRMLTVSITVTVRIKGTNRVKAFM